MAKTLRSHCRGLGTGPWSENQTSHVTTKSLNAEAKRSLVLQLIPGTVQKKKKRRSKEGVDVTTEAKSWADTGKGPRVKEHRWPPDAGKSKETDFPVETPEGGSPVDILNLVKLILYL